MSTFDKFNFEQRAYAIQQLDTLTALLKEANFAEELIRRGVIHAYGQPRTRDVEQKILEFCLNHFGTPYSHEGDEP